MNANNSLPAAPAPRESRRRVIASGAAVAAAPALVPLVPLAPLAPVSPVPPLASLTSAGAGWARLDGLEAALRQQLVGQDGAVAAVAGALRRLRPAPLDPRPVRASFLFLGPAGVGKTMLAGSLAERLYGAPQALVKVTPGAPEGGAGAESEGRVLLLDDVDAAPAGALDALLRLLDSHHNSVLVLTSGAPTTGAWAPPGGPAMKAALLERIDQVVLFRPLEWPQRRLLVQRMLQGTREGLLAQGVGLDVEDGALDWLAGAGFDPAAGARPLRRLLQEEVQAPLARLAQAGETPPGSRVRIGAGGPGPGGLRIEAVRPSPLRPGQERQASPAGPGQER
jgi:hypothetical protein